MKLAYEQSTETYSVFVDYAPHVEYIKVRIHVKGWEVCDDYDHCLAGYLDNEHTCEQLDGIILTMNMVYDESDERATV